MSTALMVPLEVGMAIGKILSIRESKLYLRSKNLTALKTAQQELSTAQSDYSAYGMYDDCGLSYEMSLVEAKAKAKNAQNDLSLIISFEKYLKKERCAFLEKYPEWKYLFEQEFNAQTERIQKQNRCVVSR